MFDALSLLLCDLCARAVSSVAKCRVAVQQSFKRLMSHRFWWRVAFQPDPGVMQRGTMHVGTPKAVHLHLPHIRVVSRRCATHPLQRRQTQLLMTPGSPCHHWTLRTTASTCTAVARHSLYYGRLLHNWVRRKILLWAVPRHVARRLQPSAAAFRNQNSVQQICRWSTMFRSCKYVPHCH